MATESVESGEPVPGDDSIERIRRLCWCGIYARQSRDTNSEYSSCEAQLDACLAVVKSRFGDGWVYDGRQYEDEAESSETLERPGLQRLLKRIREGKVDRVVVIGWIGSCDDSWIASASFRSCRTGRSH